MGKLNLIIVLNKFNMQNKNNKSSELKNFIIKAPKFSKESLDVT